MEAWTVTTVPDSLYVTVLRGYSAVTVTNLHTTLGCIYHVTTTPGAAFSKHLSPLVILRVEKTMVAKVIRELKSVSVFQKPAPELQIYTSLYFWYIQLFYTPKVPQAVLV